MEEILTFEKDLRAKLQMEEDTVMEFKPDVHAEAVADIEALKKQFEKDMLQIYTTVKQECGYNASRFLVMISEEGGLATAKKLIARPGGTDGFVMLWEHRRLDLSVEAYVLKPEYELLFTKEEREMCRKRLEDYGYKNGKYI